MKRYRIWVEEPGDKWQLNIPGDNDTIWEGIDFLDACDNAVEFLSRKDRNVFSGYGKAVKGKVQTRSLYGFNLTPFK